MARSALGQNGNSAIKGFSWEKPVVAQPTVIPPGMTPVRPVIERYPIEAPNQPRLVHGLPVSVAKRIHATLLPVEETINAADLYPRANRGRDTSPQKPSSRDGVLVPVYDSSTGAPKVDRYGDPIMKTIPYLGGDRLSGPFAAEFADPGPAPVAAANYLKALRLPAPPYLEAKRNGEYWQGPHTDVPAGYIPPVNPTKPRKKIRGNGGYGPARGGVYGKTPLPGQ